MDTYFDLSFLLSEPEGKRTPPNEPFDPNAPSTDPFDFLVDAERVGGQLSTNFCVIC